MLLVLNLLACAFFEDFLRRLPICSPIWLSNYLIKRGRFYPTTPALHRTNDLGGRFRDHEDKILTHEPVSGYDATEVQPWVQDRGGEAGGGSGSGGGAGRA